MGGRVADGGDLDPGFARSRPAAGRVELGRHTVAGYFLEEVLSLQPPEVVEFMLATSVLDELSVPACTALCGQGSAKMLELLYGAHMFVAIVDDEAGTYRYHQLIREVLQPSFMPGTRPGRSGCMRPPRNTWLRPVRLARQRGICWPPVNRPGPSACSVSGSCATC